MKKKVREFIISKKDYYLITFLSLLPLISVFITPQLISTHDGLVHLPRLASFYQALMDGQFPVRWAGNLNYGYGMPLFVFIYHLPYYVGSTFLFLGFGLLTSFKLSLTLSFVLSGIFMLLFTRYFFEDSKRALLVTVLYQFAAFRFVELLVRGSYGEVYTYAFLPLVLYFVFKLFKRHTFQSFFFASVSTALLVITHNSVSLLFYGTIVLFIILFSRSKKNFIYGMSATVVGLLISAHYWMPALLEHRYTYGNLFMKEVYMDHFPPLGYFFFPNLFNSSAFLVQESVPVSLGIFHTVAIIIVLGRIIFYRFQKTVDKRIYLYAFLLLAVAFFFMTPVSKPLWSSDFASFLRQFQFPWRFMAIVVFATSLLGIVYLSVSQFREKLSYWGLIFFIVFSSIAFWIPQEGYDSVNEEEQWTFPLTTTYYGETDTIWSAGPQKEYPDQRIEIIGGEGTIDNVDIRSHLHTYTLNAQSDVHIVDHTQYFPGWRVYLNGDQVPIEFQDVNHRGEITFSASPGDYVVRAQFEDSKVRYGADLVSLVTVIALIFGSFILSVKKRFR